MKLFSRKSHELYELKEASTKDRLFIMVVYSPVSSSFELDSFIFNHYLEKYKDDVVRFDRNVGGHKIERLLLEEFTERFINNDPYILKIINDNHPTLYAEI